MTPDTRDYDRPDPRLVAELVGRYERAAERLRDRVLDPPGSSDRARRWNQARAAQILTQVNAEIARLKRHAAEWTGRALEQAMRRGTRLADEQAAKAGVINTGSPLVGSFALVDRGTVEVLARDTVGDLTKAADSMQAQAGNLLRRMAAEGVTNAEVNAILTGGVIEGRPPATIRQLRDALIKVHGKRVTITDKNGQPRSFPAGYYAKMVAVTKTREATRLARHARLRDKGIDLVKVVGKISVNFCTAYLDKVYSISGEHPDYPPVSALPGDGPPFHVQCSKSTAPFVEVLADPVQVEDGKPDPDTDKLLNIQDRSELQRRFQALQLKTQAEARRRRIRGRSDAGRRVLTGPTDDVGYQASVLRDLGVQDVQLGRHADVGAMVVRATQRVVAAGGTVPRAIIVDELYFLGRPVSTIGVANYNDLTVALDPLWPGWRDGGRLVRRQYERGWSSSPDPLHVIYHELAHIHAARLGVNHHMAPLIGTLERGVARSVSGRAAVNKDEFLAEVRAAKMAGRRLGQDVLDLYERLGGR
ncbi:MAG: hypothetical protein Kow00105_05790 [Phycisphaeraceae bacterium]